MARAPETGFYFEPIGERLALVVEGSPFPSDDHWAWLGDPIAMTPEQAQHVVAVRWPGVDPFTLEVEFDLNFDRAVKAKEHDDLEKKLGITHQPLEFDIDIDQLLTQAQSLQEQVRQMSLGAPSKQADEAAAEAAKLRVLIAQAQELTQPNTPGRAMTVAEVQPHGAQLARFLDGLAESRAQSGPARSEPVAPALEKPTAAPVLIPEIMPTAPKPEVKSRPRPPARAAPKSAHPPAPEPPPEPKPEPKPAPRRPNIRDKR